MIYIYKLTTRGLCSELNSLLGFYESVIHEDCQIYIDSCESQYFKNITINDIFDFPDMFISNQSLESINVSADQWMRSASKRFRPSKFVQLCYKKDFQDKISSNINKINLPEDYQCFHIRRGDKVGEQPVHVVESKRFEFCDYFKRCDRSIDNIFIMTDDYACVDEAAQYLKHNNMTHKLYYIVTPEKKGHSTITDLDNNKGYNSRELVDFFTEIEIAKRSKQFVGTESSNIFRYIMNQCTSSTVFKSIG